MLGPRPFGAAVLCVAIAAAACSGDEAAPPATSASTTAPTSTTADPASPTADGVLRIGVLVPRTGGQAALGPALEAAARLAVEDVNDAGGVLGRPVELLVEDAGDATTDTAGASVDTFAGQKVDVIVAPPSSGVTSLVLDKVARSTAALVSPGNAPADPPADVPWYQLGPSLELLGAAVGTHAAAKGLPSALIVARDDTFGRRVAAAASETLTAAGTTATVQAYNPESDVYTSDVAAALAAGPAQVVLIGYAELGDFLTGFINQGVLPATFPITIATDRLDQALFRRFSQPVLQGLTAVAPAAERAPGGVALAQRLPAAARGAVAVPFAAEVYDAVVVSALGAARAGSDAPRAVRDAVGEVTGGEGDGEACAEVGDCLTAAADGPVSWLGAAGPYQLDAAGVPAQGHFAVYVLGADNTLAGATVTTLAVGG